MSMRNHRPQPPDWSVEISREHIEYWLEAKAYQEICGYPNVWHPETDCVEWFVPRDELMVMILRWPEIGEMSRLSPVE